MLGKFSEVVLTSNEIASVSEIYEVLNEEMSLSFKLDEDMMSSICELSIDPIKTNIIGMCVAASLIKAELKLVDKFKGLKTICNVKNKLNDFVLDNIDNYNKSLKSSDRERFESASPFVRRKSKFLNLTIGNEESVVVMKGGYLCLISDEAIDTLIALKPTLHKGCNKFVGTSGLIVHRVIMEARAGYEIHHKNVVTADIRFSNLVELTPEEHKEAHRNIKSGCSDSSYIEDSLCELA